MVIQKRRYSRNRPESSYYPSVYPRLIDRTEITAIVGIIPVVTERKHLTLRNIDTIIIYSRIGSFIHIRRIE